MLVIENSGDFCYECQTKAQQYPTTLQVGYVSFACCNKGLLEHERNGISSFPNSIDFVVSVRKNHHGNSGCPLLVVTWSILQSVSESAIHHFKRRILWYKNIKVFSVFVITVKASPTSFYISPNKDIVPFKMSKSSTVYFILAVVFVCVCHLKQLFWW